MFISVQSSILLISIGKIQEPHILPHGTEKQIKTHSILSSNNFDVTYIALLCGGLAEITSLTIHG